MSDNESIISGGKWMREMDEWYRSRSVDNGKVKLDKAEELETNEGKHISALPPLSKPRVGVGGTDRQAHTQPGASSEATHPDKAITPKPNPTSFAGSGPRIIQWLY